MKLTFAFIAATTASFVKFTDPVASGTDDCVLKYHANGQLLTEDVNGGIGCDIAPVKANRDAIAAHRNAMTEVIKSISNTVCKHQIDPESQVINIAGKKEHHDWRQDGDHGTAFCKYDCKTFTHHNFWGQVHGFHEADLTEGGADECVECITECPVGSILAAPLAGCTAGQCTATCKPTCKPNPDMCPATYWFKSSHMITPTSRHYGHEQDVACPYGTRAVNQPKIICDSTGAWKQQGKCVSIYNPFDVQVTEEVNTCAGITIARCPYNEVAIGGGMYNMWERNSAIRGHASSLFEEARPAGAREWVCDMGGPSDCGHVTCFAVCVPGSTVEVTDVVENYDHTGASSSGSVLANAAVTATCPAGYQVTGVGMSNHKHTYDASSLFEEFSYEGNGAKCNMGAAGTVPDFSCYARCAKAKASAGVLTCNTVESDEGLHHNLDCATPYKSSDGSGEQAVGAGMRQQKDWGTNGVLSWFENAQPRAGTKSGVHCDSGDGNGLNTCQARCCSYNPN